MDRFFRRFFVIALLLAPSGLLLPERLAAQDVRQVASPNGQFEFRLFVGQPEGALWPRIGYQVFFRGQPLIGVSWMGLDILNQEPYLAENPGFISSSTASNAAERYNSLVARYMQNGSLGRRLNIEIRAYDDGVAFRYIMPVSTPLEEIAIRDEVTQFNFAQPGALGRLPAKPDFDLPFAVEQSGEGWTVIADAGSSGKYPPTYLVRSDNGMTTNLARSKNEPNVAYSGATPLTWPWRVILAGPDKERLLQSETLKSLNR